MSLVAELKRRNVFRVAAAYVVAGWLLTEVLTTVLPTLGAPDWASRAVVLFFALGFLPTVVFAWIYEITPQGIRKQSEVDRDDTLTSTTGRRLEYLTIGAVVVGVLFLALFGSRPAEEPAPVATTAANPNSVAVLPFANLSNNPDNEYFSDGLTETLLHMLAQVPDLKVAARTSSFAFKGENRPIGEIAAALGVAHVLEGSVQRSGDRVRITAQLIRAEDSFHIWSASYDRELDDIFAIQDEIAAEVGNALSESILGPAAASGSLDTDNADAYDLYLQALNERSTYSYWGLQAEEDLLKGALTVDPGFTAAKTALAVNYVRQVETGLMEERTGYAQVVALTEQVLEVRPRDVDARALELFVGSAGQQRDITPERLRETVAQLDAVVAEHPSELEPRMLLTRLLRRLRQHERALVVMEEALANDPLNPQILYELGTLHTQLEEWDAARSRLEESLAIESQQPNAYMSLANISLHAGDGVAFVQHILHAIEVDPTDHELPGVLALFLYELGLVEAADDFRNRVRAIAPTSGMTFQLEMSRAIATGNVKASAAAARRAVTENIANRRNAFADAAGHLLRVAIRQGTVEQALAFLQRQSPGIFDVDAEALPLKYRAAQFAALDAWYLTLPREALLDRIDRLSDVSRAYGLGFASEPTSRFALLALRGETRAAIEVALNDILVDSALQHPGWRRTLEQAQYADIVTDERIQAGLQRWAAEEAAVREQVRSYLGDMQTAST